MLFDVDFSVKSNGDFQTVHKALIFANSVTECKDLADEIKNNLKENKNIYIFIEA